VSKQVPITNKTVITSLIWKFLERGGVQGIQFVLSVILARLLTPSDYGVVALITIFIQIATVFVHSGFNTALIQKKDADELDFSSVFYLSFFVALLLYIILFFTSPLIAKFYSQPTLVPIIRVLSITLFFNSLTSVQSAMVSKTMQFKRFFYSSMGGVIGSGIIGIVLAYKGFGAWSLVIQQLVNAALICIILFFTVKWRPALFFSFTRIKTLFSFGWKLLFSGLLDTVFRNLYGLIIGKTFSSATLGFFNRGQQFPQVIATNLDGSIQSVMLPTLSAVNDDVQRVKQLARRSISMSSFLLVPCMAGLAAIAEPLVLLLLTEKWLPCVPFLQLACISYALYPIHTANLTAINAMGRSDIFLKLEIVKKVLTVVVLAITIPLGIIPMAIGQVCSSIISTFINAYPNKKLMNYSYFEQIRDIVPAFGMSLILIIIVKLVQIVPIPIGIGLILQIISGAFVYILVSKFSQNESYKYAISLIKRK